MDQNCPRISSVQCTRASFQCKLSHFKLQLVQILSKLHNNKKEGYLALALPGMKAIFFWDTSRIMEAKPNRKVWTLHFSVVKVSILLLLKIDTKLTRWIIQPLVQSPKWLPMPFLKAKGRPNSHLCFIVKYLMINLTFLINLVAVLFCTHEYFSYAMAASIIVWRNQA